ncbi:hypothetical protein F8M41_011737 [Gigaspora margarita]|uniref:ZSWIM1/3 RNaseH-like domain-containing protein n=1 Tax=Gigaspora margarita TaxID=4874 RepID=A0A8H4EUU6_GIGMA|nr:hypothetical protein F8M41_011737 [Gigaspora margarita]
MKTARVLCLNGTHGMNHYGFHLFTIIMHHATTRSRYPIAFLISEFKRSSTLKRWLDFLKNENENLRPDIFIVNDAGEEIKAIEKSFLDSSIFLYHFRMLCSWCRRLDHKHSADVNPNKAIVWQNL